MSRDFAGYANQYPNVRWPHGAQLAVAVVLNIEEGAELALSSGDERNEARHQVTHEVTDAPDLCMESHFEYGARVGYWRITALAEAFGVPLTLNACARALDITPWIGQHAAEAGYENLLPRLALGIACRHGTRRRVAGADRAGGGDYTARAWKGPRWLAHQVLALGAHASPAG